MAQLGGSKEEVNGRIGSPQKRKSESPACMGPIWSCKVVAMDSTAFPVLFRTSINILTTTALLNPARRSCTHAQDSPGSSWASIHRAPAPTGRRHGWKGRGFRWSVWAHCRNGQRRFWSFPLLYDFMLPKVGSGRCIKPLKAGL